MKEKGAMELKELGLPPKKIAQLNKKKMFTTEDVISFFPRKYYDFRVPRTPRTVRDGDRCSMILIIKEIRLNERSKLIDVKCRERETYSSVSVKFFNQNYRYEELSNLNELEVAVCGRITVNQYGYSFLNPDVFTLDIDKALAIYPVYSKISGMSDAYFQDVLSKSFENVELGETVSDKAIELFSLISEEQMYKCMHFPKDEKDITEARKRKVFDVLYNFSKEMVLAGANGRKTSPFMPKLLTNCNKLVQSLPYSLTQDQKDIINSFIIKARKGERIHALLQGDVGSGKTVVAFLLMLSMSDNGYQSVLMAPTGILARQHYEELCRYIEPFGLRAAFLSGDLKAAKRKEILRQIKFGEVQFIVGTHAVISKGVEFDNLGLTVVDEEHKFGVLQREALEEKANEGVHSISMSATPIPRSLALTMYGESFDIYTIQTMPNGRKPIDTRQYETDEEVFEFIQREVKSGHQAYIVCPLIEESNKDDDKKPESVNEVYEKARRFFPQNVNIEVITGKMKDEEKSDIIRRFSKNEVQILIATTIIEVGVNVPNTTVIGIMDADMFGLSGLHQLRGRVGRSSLQSYCLLRSSDLENARLQAMIETNNGFELAEKDLSLRGTGELIGTRQSGSDINMELALKYPRYYNDIKDFVKEELGLENQ